MKREFTDKDFILGIQKGYIDAAIFTDCNADNPELEDADFSDECLKQFDEDCEKFFNKNKELLRASGLHPDECGHDFWLTRNGHGAGFWDRGIGEIGEKLSKACGYGTEFSNVDLYADKNGKIYQG